MQVHTDRLRLVPFAATDAAELGRQWNEPPFRRFLFDDQPVSEAQVSEQLAASRRAFAERGCGFFTLRPRDEAGRRIGFAGLRRYGEPERTELLYGLEPARWGQGLATEASRAVLDLAFRGLGLDSVDAGADPPNAASFRVMERLGMRLDRELVLHGRPARYHRIERPAFLASGLPPGFVVIRAARSAADVAETRALFLEYAAGLGVDLSFQDFESELAGLPGDYTAPDGLLLLARVGGAAAGCVAVHRCAQGVAEMKRLFVSPGCRGRHLGARLARLACEFARERGYAKLRLDTLPQMQDAQRLYASLGFREIAAYRPNPVPGARFLELDLG